MAYESGVAWLRDRRLLARREEPTRSRVNVICDRVNSPVYAGDAGVGDLEGAILGGAKEPRHAVYGSCLLTCVHLGREQTVTDGVYIYVCIYMLLDPGTRHARESPLEMKEGESE